MINNYTKEYVYSYGELTCSYENFTVNTKKAEDLTYLELIECTKFIVEEDLIGKKLLVHLKTYTSITTTVKEYGGYFYVDIYEWDKLEKGEAAPASFQQKICHLLLNLKELLIKDSTNSRFYIVDGKLHSIVGMETYYLEPNHKLSVDFTEDTVVDTPNESNHYTGTESKFLKDLGKYNF